MQIDVIEILVSFDKKYIGPFRVMLRSLAATNPGERFRVWLLHSAIPGEALQALADYCAALGISLSPLKVNRALFEAAPVSKRYPREMYYRLLAPALLPPELERVLYLDPDILVLNPVRPLWEQELGGRIFAAAAHSGAAELVDGVNRARLGSGSVYFNTGVLLMDLTKARESVRSEAVFACVEEEGERLLLPDQDVFNRLYGASTLPLEDTIWNYDARHYSAYRLRSMGKCSLDWIMQNTVFLHFCGRQKPWKAGARGRFAALYKHYSRLAERAE